MLKFRIPVVSALCVGFLSVQNASCFTPTGTVPSKVPNSEWTSTTRFPHSFGAYDAADSKQVSWTPSEAAEFANWHAGKPAEAGMQIRPMITKWCGSDVGEFLSRLYLGEVIQDENRINYCPSNVRSPQWRGLEDKGLEAMSELLIAALPDKALSAPELARCGQSFLLREHRWPSVITSDGAIIKAPKKPKADPEPKKTRNESFESDTFAARGYAAGFGTVLGNVRRSRMPDFMPEDVIKMCTLPEKSEKDSGYINLQDFFSNLGIKMTEFEKVETVSGMALAGWAPGNIANFVCSIELIKERPQDLSQLDPEEAAALEKEAANKAAFLKNAVPPPPVKSVKAEFVDSLPNGMGGNGFKQA